MLNPSTPHLHVSGRPSGRRVRLVGALIAAASSITSLTLADPAWATDVPSTYDYVVSGEVHETHQAASGEPTICAEGETATYDGTFTVHLTSTVLGLSDEEVLALLDDEPDGSVLHVTFDGAGTLVQRSGTHVYSTAYTDQYHGDVHGASLGFHSTFVARGYSELGTRYSLVSRGAFLIVNGQFHESRTPVQVKGCLPSS